MTSHIRHRRSYDPTVSFNLLEPGELAPNTANRQLWLGDANGTPLPAIAVRAFATASQYAANDLVVENGDIWRANAAIVPGPWDPTKWATLLDGGTF